VARALVVLVLLAGCGARSGLGAQARDGGALDAASIPDATPPTDARADAPMDAAPDAGEPLACDGRALPRPGPVSSFPIPARLAPIAALVPEAPGVLVAGATATGTRVERMLFFDLSSERVDELAVLGDPVELPGGQGLAVHVPEREGAVVIGGRLGDGAPTDQAFLVTAEDDPDVPRGVRAARLPPHPAGPVDGLVGIHDPVANRVVVHGGDADGGTWALELDGEPRWRALVAPADSPPPGVRAMGYDPSAHRAVEITADEDGEGVAVFALSLARGGERWERLGPIDFVPSVRGELHWDPRVCGFHLLSARRTRCVLEHWILVPTAPRPTTVLRGELDLAPPHFLAAGFFVAATDELVVFGGEDCDEVGWPNRRAHRVALVR
jgi:hypothetical protein